MTNPMGGNKNVGTNWTNNPGYESPIHNNPLYDPQASKTAPQQPVSPKDYKPSKSILSGNELVAKMGSAPKQSEKLGLLTIWSHSTEYKKTLSGLESFNSQLTALKDTPLSNVSAKDIQKLKAALDKVSTQAEAYANKHYMDLTPTENNNKPVNPKQGRINVMNEVKTAALRELTAFEDLAKLTNHSDKNFTLGEALALTRAGVTDATHFNRALSDDKIDKGKSKDNFGSGKVNTVSLIVYGKDERVVKPLVKENDRLKPGERLVDFDPKDQKIAMRNMNSASIAKVLKMPNLIPQPHIAIHNDEAVLAMPKAKGECFVEKGGNKLQFRDTGLGPTTDPTVKANVFKGLLDLQGLDCINAQVDRQPENYFIQVLPGKQVQVTGIDNDMAGGAQMTKIEIQPHQEQRLTATYGGPPPLMSREFFDKLMATSEQDIRNAMSPETPQDHVDAEVSRFKELKQHAAALQKDKCIVDNFETWTHKDPKSDKIVGVEDYLKNSNFRSYPQRMYVTMDKTEQKGGKLLVMDPSKHV